MTPTATTTEIIGIVEDAVSVNAPQMLLILIGMLSAVFIYVLAKRAIKWIYAKISKF